MPLRDWRCMVCGFVMMDILHPADLDKCVKCNSRSWTKVPVAPNFKVVGGTEKFHDRGEK